MRRRLPPLLGISTAAQHPAAAAGTCRCQKCIQPCSIRSRVATGSLQHDVEGTLQCGGVSVTGMALHSRRCAAAQLPSYALFYEYKLKRQDVCECHSYRLIRRWVL